ncbi:hypothetical protein TGVAND_359620 [Toxoplasma gondii VAND]|uniref:Uncharacterized protein n=1 Tax=Toxoplasma gondii VAND TaxID=933077 RepID=A0A086PIZ3_TOXGO|nr:hypothetical protein TGVAND_359620 [Toxoplasma gondii VAND]
MKMSLLTRASICWRDSSRTIHRGDRQWKRHCAILSLCSTKSNREGTKSWKTQIQKRQHSLQSSMPVCTLWRDKRSQARLTEKTKKRRDISRRVLQEDLISEVKERQKGSDSGRPSLLQTKQRVMTEGGTKAKMKFAFCCSCPSVLSLLPVSLLLSSRLPLRLLMRDKDTVALPR